MMYCDACRWNVELSGAEFCPHCGRRLHSGKREPLCEVAGEVSVYHWLDYGAENIFLDYGVRRCDAFSYCIRDTRANDLRIKRIFRAEPDTVYLVRVDVKTEGVVNHENTNNPIGACISTNDWFCSESLFGDNDWRTIGLPCHSDKDGNLFVSLNLGYTFNTCSGCVWFENFRFIPIEKQINVNNMWRFLAVVLTETGIDTIDEETGKRLTLTHSMSQEERRVIRESLVNFERDFNQDGEGLIGARVDISEMRTRCDAYTKTDIGYLISGPDACRYLEENGIRIEAYDHIFMIACQPSLPVKYYGLGGLPIKNRIGFSFILHTDVEESLSYLSGERKNSWPSAIYMHEFLHSIEACANSLGLPVPMVDGERDGYANFYEYRLWYRDFIHNKVEGNPTSRGVDPRVLLLRPSLF